MGRFAWLSSLLLLSSFALAPTACGGRVATDDISGAPANGDMTSTSGGTTSAGGGATSASGGTSCEWPIADACAAAAAGSLTEGVCTHARADTEVSTWSPLCRNSQDRLLVTPMSDYVRLLEAGIDTSTTYYVDKASGKLVAIVAQVNGKTSCIAGPAAFQEPATASIDGATTNVCCPSAPAGNPFVDCPVVADAGSD
jgi:hypothetical protein